MIPIGGSEHSDYSEPSNLMGRYSDILTENINHISSTFLPTPSHHITCRAAEDVSRLSLTGLSLSSVTAQVGKQIGVMSGGTGAQHKTTQQTKIHQPTLLHKRIYEKNLTVNNNVRIFFKASFFLPTLKIKAITQNTKVPVQLKCLNLHHRT